jgi:hypothetical protein
MNTLPRAITAQVLADSNTYYSIRQQWSELMQSPRKHELKAVHHLLYLALLGKDWRKGFTCVSNGRKLDNGAFYGWALFKALAALHMPSHEAEILAPFDGIVPPIMLQRLRELVPYENSFKHRPEQFAAGFPFDAYRLPESFQSTIEERSADA